MSLPGLPDSRRPAILTCWRKRVLATYPEQSAKLLGGKRGGFGNPAGEILARCTAAVVEGLFAGADRERMAAALHDLVRLRSVQEFSPSEAVGIYPTLKEAAREAVGNDPVDLAEFDRRVDALTLLAFDLHVGCRERVLELRAKMMRDRSYMLMRRAGMLWEESGEGEAVAGRSADERGDGR
jgi:hypothetical protein